MSTARIDTDSPTLSLSIASDPHDDTVLDHRPAIVPGTMFGHYRVLEPLADGGMGMVFLGEDTRLGRKVALKFLHQRFLGDASAVPRFFAEALAAARISHPGAVSVFDYGSLDTGSYLVMEYLAGESLSARIEREGRLPIARVLDIGVELAHTLAAAHEVGVIHRDLKPSNIHLVPDPAGSGHEFVKVLDFGIAKLLASKGPPLTQRGDMLGTPFYMAPEQSFDPSTVDHRCDIYALGCVLYQLVTGTVPFRGSLIEILLAHQNLKPLPPSSFDPAIPPALDALILRMMAKSREGRPGSMAEVVSELSSIQGAGPHPVAEGGNAAAQPLPLRQGMCVVAFLVGLGLLEVGLRYLASLW